MWGPRGLPVKNNFLHRLNTLKKIPLGPSGPIIHPIYFLSQREQSRGFGVNFNELYWLVQLLLWYVYKKPQKMYTPKIG